MKFDERWNHGHRLVFRRIYELLVGPQPSVHGHYTEELWQFPFGLGPCVLIFFVKWQRPVTDSPYHFDKAGADVMFGPWVRCFHWLDNDARKPDEPDH